MKILLYNRADTTHQVTSELSKDAEREFTYEDTHFNFAIGFTEKTRSSLVKDITGYIELDVYGVSWSPSDD